jgi:hypothetical protein
MPNGGVDHQPPQLKIYSLMRGVSRRGVVEPPTPQPPLAIRTLSLCLYV